MTVYVMFEKTKTKKTDRIDNIGIKKNMKLTACIRVMISYVRRYALYGFGKINAILMYHNSYNMYKKKKKKNNNNNILNYSLHCYHFNRN